jgi:hypothetical protein
MHGTHSTSPMSSLGPVLSPPLALPAPAPTVMLLALLPKLTTLSPAPPAMLPESPLPVGDQGLVPNQLPAEAKTPLDAKSAKPCKKKAKGLPGGAPAQIGRPLFFSRGKLAQIFTETNLASFHLNAKLKDQKAQANLYLCVATCLLLEHGSDFAQYCHDNVPAGERCAVAVSHAKYPGALKELQEVRLPSDCFSCC